MTFTPIQAGRPKSIRDPLSGQFVMAGRHKTAEVLEGAGVSKRVMSQSELARRKKLQSHIAVTTSTLGLGALGLKGGSIAAGRVGRTAAKANEAAGAFVHSPAAVRAAKYTKLSHQLNNTAINTGIVSSGVGGVGGYNFAAYTKAEGQKKIKKSWEPGMDFGLGGVHQGEEISKKDWQNISEHERRARDSRRTRGRAKSVAGLGSTVGAAALAHGIYSGKDPFKEAHVVGRAVKGGAQGAWANKGRGPEAAFARKANLRAVGSVARSMPHGSTALAGYGTALAAGGVMAGARFNEKRHDRAIARQRRARVGKSFTEVDKSLRVPSIKLGDPAKMTVKSKVIKPKKGTFTPLSHDRQIGKAYDPERKRQNRLSRYQNATMFGSGAMALGAAQTARGAVGHKSREEWRTKKNTSFKVNAPGTGLHSPSGAVVRGSLKKLGKAGALGVGAAGLAIGSDRIKQYRKGRGRSYTPMRAIGY